MKKSLLVVLLALALVTPVFAADQGAMELDIKAGFNVMSKADTTDIDPAFTAGVDFFYYVMPQLAIGAGVQHVFNSESDKYDGIKVGWTNLYAQAKYIFETGNDIFTNIYPLVQIGYGILNLDSDWLEVDRNKLYWGIGVGTAIKENFIFEILYSAADSKVKEKGYDVFYSSTIKYSTLQLKVGYKFNF